MSDKSKVPIDQAIDFLQERLNDIDRVHEWGEAMGYSFSDRFSYKFREHFGERPKEVMRAIKTKQAIKLLINTDMSCYEIANCIGKKDEHSLFQFIKKETGKPPRMIRENHSS